MEDAGKFEIDERKKGGNRGERKEGGKEGERERRAEGRHRGSG